MNPTPGRATRRTTALVAALVSLIMVVQLTMIAGPTPVGSHAADPSADRTEPAAAASTFPDADGDGVRDDAEVDGDSDGDGIADVADADDDGDGLLTSAEGPDFENDGFTGDARDSDADGVPDYLDADDDGDGIATADELADPNGDGLPSDAVDSDGDREPDYLDAEVGVAPLEEVVIASRVLSLDGIGQGSGFGTPEAIGDINGDGVVDLAVGAFSDDTGGPDVGAVYVFLMGADGRPAATTRITRGEAGFGGGLLDGGGFGFRVAGIGDLDADGVADIIASAYRSDRVGEDAGEVWVLFLNPDGTVKDWQVITTGFGGLDAGLRPGDQFGVDIAGLGDLDGDGVPDAAVGMWRRDGVSQDEGGVLVVFLDRDGTVKTYQEISPVAGWPDSPIGGGSGFGVAVESLGDIDGDGTNDLAVGAIGTNRERGAVWLLSLTPSGTVTASGRIAPAEGPIAQVLPGVRFGSGIARMGDVDGNGVTDLAVGGFGAKSFTGAVWLLTLAEDRTVLTSRRVTAPGLAEDDLFGHTVASLGDIDGDGHVDLAVGAPGAAGTGLVHIVSLGGEPVGDNGAGDGAQGPEPQPTPEPDPAPEPEPEIDPALLPSGDLDGDGLRNDLEGIADLDGDGIANRSDTDSDGDGVPDAIEGLRDSDGDGVFDFAEFDDDGDGIPTSAEGARDTDGDGLGDHRDLDADNDGIPDSVEGLGDSDGDGLPDMIDVDSDGDGVRDGDEGGGDTDLDGTPDHIDPDADGDGVDDVVEGSGDTDGDGVQDRLDGDSDNDGVPDATEGSGDTDGDGVVDRLDEDADGDGIDDLIEGAEDLDGDGLANNVDTDADGDGLDDRLEGVADTDGDGIPNSLDTDADGDGRADADEGSGDVDGDGTPNYLDDADAEVEISVGTAGEIFAGEGTQFELQVLNKGPDPASATTAQIEIPEGVFIDPDSTPADCWVDGPLLTCDFGNVGVSESASRTIRAEVLDAEVLGKVTTLEVAATVRSNEGVAAVSTGPLAIIDPSTIAEPEGLQSGSGALIVIALAALICGGIIIALTREESLRSG